MATETSTTTAHVGLERYRSLSKDAIEISYVTGKQITAAKFMKFIIDNYSGVAKQQMMKGAGEQAAEVS